MALGLLTSGKKFHKVDYLEIRVFLYSGISINAFCVLVYT